MRTRRSLLLGSALVALLPAAVTITGPASAGAATASVDPSTLTPAPPDFFNAVCGKTGNHITCDLGFVDPVAPVEEPSGIVCGEGPSQFEVLDTWSRTVEGKRYYSADGLLLRRHFSDVWVGRFTNSVTGATVDYSERNTYLHDLAVPGDSSTGVERDTSRLRVFGANGTVLMTAGRTVLSRADDEILFQAGQHPFDAYFVRGDSSALQPLCDALS